MPRWVNRLVATVLLSPVLHRLASRSTALLTLTGRRTGHRYTLPVVYLSGRDAAEDDRTLLVTTDSRWAANLVGGAPVSLRLRGRTRVGTATTSTDPAQVRPVLALLVSRYPRRYGRAASVRLGPGRTPDPADLDRAAADRTLVRITLDDRQRPPLETHVRSRPAASPSPVDGAAMLVTGASAGIGRVLAEQLAPRAAALVLVARRVDRLSALAEQLHTAHPDLVVHAVGCDLADPTAVEALVARFGEDLPDPDVLVANAGVGDTGLLDRADWPRLARVVALNVTATTRLVHAVLPGMVERGRGGLLVIGSGAGLALMPGAATYTASKHYVHGLVQTLRGELTGTGVVVSEVCPGPVATEFDAAAGIPDAVTGPGRWLRISAEQCAAEALAGFDRGQAVILPGRTYRTLMRLQALVPLAAQRAVAARGARRLRSSASDLPVA